MIKEKLTYKEIMDEIVIPIIIGILIPAIGVAIYLIADFIYYSI